MRKLILQMMITIDGFLCGPNDEIDWIDNDPVMSEAHMQLAKDADFALFGFPLYQALVAYWPEAEKHPRPDAPASEVAFAKLMNTMPKIVLSNQEERVDWNNTKLYVAEDDAAKVAKIKELKNEGDGYIVLYGGVRTARALAAVIDEYRLDVCPVALGKGKPLFEDRTNLALVKVTPYESGAMTVIYRPKN